MKLPVFGAAILAGVLCTPATAQATCKIVHIIEVTIDNNSATTGTVNPTTELLCAGDTIVWRIKNTSDFAVTVDFKDFHIKGTSPPVKKTLSFRGLAHRIDVEPKYEGVVVAEAARSFTTLRINVKYTINVRNKLTGGAKDHDPDLEVDPPPAPPPPPPPPPKKK